MATIADLLDSDALEKIQQAFETPVTQHHEEARIRDAKSPRKPADTTNTKTHLWKGKPVTEKQFAHYARMSHEIPEQSGARAVFEVEQMLEPKAEIDPETAKALLLLLLAAAQG